jgi:lipopolysaccharide export system permease protein
MRLLRRYILRSLLAPFLFSLGALTGLLLMNHLAKRISDLIGKDLAWQVIVEVLALSVPFIIALTLPMAVLVAVLYGFSQLGSDNEITAMRASGLGVMQLLRPALWAGAILALVNFLFVDQVLPRSNARLRNLQSDIGHKKPAFQMREQAINDVQPYFVRAGSIFPGSGRLRDVEIYDLSVYDGRRVIYADSGLMAFDEDQTDLIFRLHQGRVHEFRWAEPTRIQLTRFEQNTIRVRDVENFLERNLSVFERGDREMTTCEMMDRVSASERQARRAMATRRDLAVQDLRSLMRLTQAEAGPRLPDTTRIEHCGPWRAVERAIGRVILPEPAEAQRPAAVPVVPAAPAPSRPAEPQAPGPRLTPPPIIATAADVLNAREQELSARRSANAFRVEIHKKYTISVACFTFVLIGVALALRFPRGGMGLVIGGGLLIFALFYVSLTAGESLADRNFVSPAVAMWFPNVVVLLAGLAGLARVNREFGSTRGGDLSDLVDSLLRAARVRRRVG